MGLRRFVARIPSSTVLGTLARLPLHAIPPSWAVRIQSGPLKGRRWVVGASVHGNWLGTYEVEVQAAVAKTVKRGKVFYDVGAQAGYYALLASLLVGPTGRVVAFEPDSRNVAYLTQHLRLNTAANVSVIEAAVADTAGTESFAPDAAGFEGTLVATGSRRVKTITLDRLVNSERVPPPHYLKIDVEGAELRVLRGAARVLKAFRPVVFLAVHTPEMKRLCAETLARLRYTGEPITRDVWLYRAARITP